ASQQRGEHAQERRAAASAEAAVFGDAAGLVRVDAAPKQCVANVVQAGTGGELDRDLRACGGHRGAQPFRSNVGDEPFVTQRVDDADDAEAELTAGWELRSKRSPGVEVERVREPGADRGLSHP